MMNHTRQANLLAIFNARKGFPIKHKARPFPARKATELLARTLWTIETLFA